MLFRSRKAAARKERQEEEDRKENKEIRAASQRTEELYRLGAPERDITKGFQYDNSSFIGPKPENAESLIQTKNAFQERQRQRGIGRGANPERLNDAQLNSMINNLEEQLDRTTDDEVALSTAKKVRRDRITAANKGKEVAPPASPTPKPEDKGFDFKGALRSGIGAVQGIMRGGEKPAAQQPAQEEKVIVMKQGKKFRLPKSQLNDAIKEGYTLVK